MTTYPIEKIIVNRVNITIRRQTFISSFLVFIHPEGIWGLVKRTTNTFINTNFWSRSDFFNFRAVFVKIGRAKL